jgi:WD40 repeat protein
MPWPTARTAACWPAGNAGTVPLWETGTDQPHGPPLTDHVAAVWGVAFSPDGRLLANAGTAARVRLWNVGTVRAVAIELRQPEVVVR